MIQTRLERTRLNVIEGHAVTMLVMMLEILDCFLVAPVQANISDICKRVDSELTKLNPLTTRRASLCPAMISIYV